MDFALFYEIQVNSPLKHRHREREVFDHVLDQVVLAEEMGFTNFWTVEHHFQPGFSHSSAPEVLYGAVSQRTKKIRIGHAVVLLPFPYNHPVRIAERVATLDILSHGRVDVGTGRSSTVQELWGFGIPPEETRPRWDEALRILTEIWASGDGTFSHKGRYFDIPERTVVPMPVQKPHPPLWLASSHDYSHEIAGRMGMGLLTLVVATPPDEVARRIQIYDDATKDQEPVSPLAVNNQKAVFYMGHCAETDEQAKANAERSFLSIRGDRRPERGAPEAADRGHAGCADAPRSCRRSRHQHLHAGLDAGEPHRHLREPGHVHPPDRGDHQDGEGGPVDAAAAVLGDAARADDEVDRALRQAHHSALRKEGGSSDSVARAAPLGWADERLETLGAKR